MIQLTDEQQVALGRILDLRSERRAEISLSGPAGTGKTTLMKHLMPELDDEAVVVTPTNKAAKVLRSKGLDASTLYSVFFSALEEQTPTGKRLRFVPNCELPPKSLGEGKLDFCDTIVIDEASMLKSWELKQLRRMCNTLVLVGDPHQLPPVNDKSHPDGYFCTKAHDIELTTVLRQAGDSPILELATHIRNRRFPAELVRSFAPKRSFSGWLTHNEPQKVLAFTNAHRRDLNMTIRRSLGRGLGADTAILPQPGDILVSNDNVTDTIVNGSEVVVQSFKWSGAVTGDLLVTDENGDLAEIELNVGKFLADQPPHLVPGRYQKIIDGGRSIDEGAFLTYGYAITAHKAQGSEWDEVCVIDERYVLAKVDPTGETMRRWLYTGITRAAKRLVFAEFPWVKVSRDRVAA